MFDCRVKMVMMAGDRAEYRSVAADDFINDIRHSNEYLSRLQWQQAMEIRRRGLMRVLHALAASLDKLARVALKAGLIFGFKVNVLLPT